VSYQVHRPSPDTDVEETLGALTDLVRQGKVRYIGSSSYSCSEIVEAQWTARERHLERFRTEQPPYSLLVRDIELDVLPTAQRHGMRILTYSPLSGGWLSGSWSADSSPTSPARQRLAKRFDMSLPENQRKLEAVEQLAQIADDAGLTLIELALPPRGETAPSTISSGSSAANVWPASAIARSKPSSSMKRATARSTV
jgi:aryl-alcohol dehydrogenase-like predicted oxidoreductase